MKTKEELNALKEVETLNKKLHELTDEELAQVSGGGLVAENAAGAEKSRSGKDTGKDPGKTENEKNTGENTFETYKPIV